MSGKIFLVTLTLLTCQHLFPQQKLTSDYPIIGQPCPDFTLNDVVNYKVRNVSLKDFKGQYLILEFWSSHCISCIENFPHLNQMGNKFDNLLQFLLIAQDDESVRPIYEKFKKKFSLNLPNAYESLLFDRFEISAVPYFVWIDRSGIVRHITLVTEVTEMNVESFISEKQIALNEYCNNCIDKNQEALFDYNKTYLINGNGGNDSNFLFRSLLGEWSSSLGVNYNGFFSPLFGKTNEVSLIGVSLDKLYQLAYYEAKYPIPLRPDNIYGKFWLKPILEITDSSLFKPDFRTGKNIFCYSLKVPTTKASVSYMQKVLQNDLQNYFGYKVAIEERRMPCWKLTATNDAKIKLATKGGAEEFEGNLLSGFKLVNQPVFELIRALWAPRQNEPPFVDETGIFKNIDLTLSCGVSDLEEVILELKQKGLHLFKSTRMMKVLVLRD